MEKNIKIEKSLNGFIGSLKLLNTFILAKGSTKKEVIAEIKQTLLEF